jgi:hypothetical protein
VATLLSTLHDPTAIEERTPLPDLLAPLDRDTLHALLLRLAEQDPSLADRVEAQLSLLTNLTSPTGAGPAAAPPPPPPTAPVSVAAVRRELRSMFHGIGRWRGYDSYGSVGSISGGVDQVLQSAWSLIHVGMGRDALPVLEAITEEVWSRYEELDDSDGEGVPLFAGIGAAWTEALLSPDVTRQERQSWGAKLEGWRDELADYGLEEGFAAAVHAAEQGWDDPALVRVLQGQDTGASLWLGEERLPHWIDDEALARARLNVLEHAKRWDEHYSQQVIDQIEAPNHDPVGDAPAHLRPQRRPRRARVSLAWCIVPHMTLSHQLFPGHHPRCSDRQSGHHCGLSPDSPDSRSCASCRK